METLDPFTRNQEDDVMPEADLGRVAGALTERRVLERSQKRFRSCVYGTTWPSGSESSNNEKALTCIADFEYTDAI